MPNGNKEPRTINKTEKTSDIKVTNINITLKPYKQMEIAGFFKLKNFAKKFI